MKKVISMAMASVLLASLFLFGACTQETKATINVYNWGQYIDETVLKDFKKETGIKVVYSTYDSNETMYSKISTGAADYDVVIPSDYMISKMIEEDLLAELNFANIPNYSMIGEEYKNLEFDPNNAYSVPYTWGTVVIFYDKTQVAPEDVKDKSINLLWNEKYSGKILMFENPRDAFGLSLIKNGFSLNSENPVEWQKAADDLKAQKPLVQAYVMDQIFDKLGSGEAAIAPYYAGDGPLIQEQNPNIDYYIPTEGTNMFVDSMCVLKSSKNKAAAEAFINFMCKTDVALKTANTIGYATPQVEAAKSVDPRLLEDKCIYADEATLANTEVFKNLPKEISVLQSNLWTEIKRV